MMTNCRHLRHRADGARYPSRGAGSGPLAVGCRNALRVRLRYGGQQYWSRRTAILPVIFTLFTFILFANLLGMIPFSYAATSQIIVTFALAAVVFILVTTIGIIRHGFQFPQPLRAAWRAEGAAVVAGADRVAVLLHPPVHAVDPALCEYAGRTHDAGDFRRLCREYRLSGILPDRDRRSARRPGVFSSRCCRPMSSPS